VLASLLHRLKKSLYFEIILKLRYFNWIRKKIHHSGVVIHEDVSHPASRGRRDASSGRAWAILIISAGMKKSDNMGATFFLAHLGAKKSS